MKYALSALLAFVILSAAPAEARRADKSPIAFSVSLDIEKPKAAKPSKQRAAKYRPAAGRSADVIALASRYIGTNPTKMRRLWCANFLGMIEKKAGRPGTGSNFARSYASYGRKVTKPQPGDIAVMARGKRGGHVGYFVGWAPNGRAILISGNSRGGVVSKGNYVASRIFAWRRPA